MWISGVHIVVVYFCACAVAEELRPGTERKQSRVKRSVDSYNLYNDNYNSKKYDNYNSLSTLRLRHQSRFPNLDKVMTRINNMKLGSDEKTVNSGVHNRIRHNSWYERMTTTTTPKSSEIFGNYFDEDYEETKEEDNNWVSV
ncbi:hypothetical protein WA026_006286 [Henosepilachna vigintioctopunctata]|uniref:Uncharacterized protein n=1 Tax=Henosepilachna vigintioctopunctata TaxID=420089 RepID=A0AAW1TK76_9CUCU